MNVKPLMIASLAILNTVKAISNDRPNIILILTDDMGFSDVSCYGGKLIPTPNIDRMASEGIQFSQYYSASPISSPSRTGILTGMHPAKWHITSYLQTRKGNRECEMADYLDSKAPTIAKAMKTAGYATGHFGKWHMGGGRDVDTPPGIKEYGFDEYSSTWESPDPDPLLTSTDWIWAASDSIKRWDRTAYFVNRTLDFLKKHKGQPCYVNLWPDDVHTPWVPGQERLGIYPKGTSEQKDLKEVLGEYDRQIGRLFDGLKELGIDENTMVIFTSDNGPLPAFNGSRSGNYRGSKLSLYEGGIRMPFIVRWPAKIRKAMKDDVSVLSAADLFPSFCALAGTKMLSGFSFDGKDKSSVLGGKPSKEKRTIYWEYGRNNTSFDYPKGKDRSPGLAIREGNWKFLMNADGSDIQLYDLGKDSRETINVAAENKEITERLKAKLLKWRGSLPSYGN
ncbi:MAG TPA: sulfatase-like hydrolase/transferase [Bacteroidales bacterium]|jgi:arylsulfatase A-like enzyme|nr:sulfatase-like hydrolase/transferase [Bacteroidales bacterium]